MWKNKWTWWCVGHKWSSWGKYKRRIGSEMAVSGWFSVFLCRLLLPIGPAKISWPGDCPAVNDSQHFHTNQTTQWPLMLCREASAFTVSSLIYSYFSFNLSFIWVFWKVGLNCQHWTAHFLLWSLVISLHNTPSGPEGSSREGVGG